MIKLSVGLISGELVWLALESLTRQKTNFKWELLISEQGIVVRWIYTRNTSLNYKR